jgi:hypothetical protein
LPEKFLIPIILLNGNTLLLPEKYGGKFGGLGGINGTHRRGRFLVSGKLGDVYEILTF